SFLWWQAVAGTLGGTSRNALRMHSRCTGRHREGARNVYNTAIRRALSPLRPGGSVTAAVYGCPRGVAPLRPPLAIWDTPGAHTGGATAPSPHHSTGCAARPSLLFSPPGHGFSTLDARWKARDYAGGLTPRSCSNWPSSCSIFSASFKLRCKRSHTSRSYF